MQTTTATISNTRTTINPLAGLYSAEALAEYGVLEAEQALEVARDLAAANPDSLRARGLVRVWTAQLERRRAALVGLRALIGAGEDGAEDTVD